MFNVSEFDKNLDKIVFQLMRDKMFVPIGLELTNTNIYFENNETFSLKELTFAYYNPIDNSVRINVEDPFFTSCKTQEALNARLLFILFHEINHKLLLHTPKRLGNKQPTLWNIAADYEVHNMLWIYIEANEKDTAISNIIKPMFLNIKNMMLDCEAKNKAMSKNKKSKSDEKEDRENPTFMFDRKFLPNIAEEIYEMIQNSKEQSSTKQKIKMSCGTGSGSGSNQGQNQNGSGNEDIEVEVEEVTYTLPNGQKVKTTNINWPKNADLPESLKKSDKDIAKDENNRNLNRSLMENSLQEVAKDKGNTSSDCNKFLSKLFHVKVDWEKILRNSLQTVLEKSDYFAWSKVRTSTFLMPGMPYLPDIIEDTEKYGTLVISIDESGSMSDEAVAKAGNIILEAKEHFKKIIVLKHDTEISETKEFEDVNDDIVKYLMTRKSCGGTSHKDVFEFLTDFYKKHHDDEEMISCYIGITDLESDIQYYQDKVPEKIPMIWLAPHTAVNHVEKIKGKIIPVEL